MPELRIKIRNSSTGMWKYRVAGIRKKNVPSEREYSHQKYGAVSAAGKTVARAAPRLPVRKLPVP